MAALTAAAAGPLLAHAGPGSTWQAMVVVAGVVMAGAVLAAGLGRLPLEGPEDLLAPVAAAAILASLGLLVHWIVSDWIGWGLPLAVVSALTLLLGALTPLDHRLPSPLPMGAIALAGVSMWALYGPLTIALHPPPEILPLSDDADLVVLAPDGQEPVPAGEVAVTLRVDGGSIGPGGVPLTDLPEDPEEAGALVVAVRPVAGDGTTGPLERVAVAVPGCTVQDPCTEVTVPVPLQAGTWEVVVELQRGDHTPLAPPVRTVHRLEVTGAP